MFVLLHARTNSAAPSEASTIEVTWPSLISTAKGEQLITKTAIVNSTALGCSARRTMVSPWKILKTRTTLSTENRRLTSIQRGTSTLIGKSAKKIRRERLKGGYEQRVGLPTSMATDS